MVHLYSAFIQGALHRLCITFTHSHTDGSGNHARYQLAHQEQLGVKCLAQGHIDIASGGAWVRTGNLAVGIQTLYPWATAAPVEQYFCSTVLSGGGTRAGVLAMQDTGSSGAEMVGELEGGLGKSSQTGVLTSLGGGTWWLRGRAGLRAGRGSDEDYMEYASWCPGLTWLSHVTV